MSYKGRVSIVIIYISIVVGWHSFYFLTDFEGSYVFMIENGQYKWDLLFIPLFSPFFWWLGYQYDRAKFLSEKDALTGLYNRRYVSQMTPKLVAQMNKKEETLTISIIDCNNFKDINDHFGHEMGDSILINIALLLLTSTSKRDIVSRWGGDEFLVISPYCGKKEAERFSEKIEIGLHRLSRELGMDISVSIGKGIYPHDSEDIKELLIMADRNMYSVKMDRNKSSIRRPVYSSST